MTELHKRILHLPVPILDETIINAVSTWDYSQAFIACKSWWERQQVLDFCLKVQAIQKKHNIKKWEPILVSIIAPEDEVSYLLEYFGDNGFPAVTYSFQKYIDLIVNQRI